jgi:hypothetical protein
VALATASCAVPPAQPSTTAAWLERFADASRFLPAGMQSHWFCDYRGLPSGDGSTIEHLEVRCGRAFQSPTDVGVGPYEGVAVEDHGNRGVPARRRADLGPARPEIAGAPVWERARNTRGMVPADAWTAIVAERFVVSASSEALLREALAQRGTPRFGSLKPLPEIAPTTISLVMRDLEGAPCPTNVLLPLNLPGVSAIVAVDSSPFHARAWGRDPKGLSALTDYCFPEFEGFRTSPSIDAAGWHSLQITKEGEDATREDWFWGSNLRSLVWFGAWIFI